MGIECDDPVGLGAETNRLDSAPQSCADLSPVGPLVGDQQGAPLTSVWDKAGKLMERFDVPVEPRTR